MSAPNNHREDSTSSWGEPCCGELLRYLHPGLCTARPDLGAGQRGCAHPSTQDGLSAHLSRVIVPRARLLHSECLM